MQPHKHEGNPETAPAPRIVVGTDGSATATVALRRAAELARERSARLHIVTAYDPGRVPDATAAAALEHGMQWKLSPGQQAEEVAQAAVTIANDAGVDTRSHAEPGDPAEVLLRVADAVGADLLVVGNRGMNGKVAMLRPTVPNRVSHRARCDVLIVDTRGAVAS